MMSEDIKTDYNLHETIVGGINKQNILIGMCARCSHQTGVSEKDNAKKIQHGATLICMCCGAREIEKEGSIHIKDWKGVQATCQQEFDLEKYRDHNT